MGNKITHIEVDNVLYEISDPQLESLPEDLAFYNAATSKPIKPTYEQYIGKYFNSKGSVAPLSGFSISDPIEIPEGMTHVYFRNLAVQPHISAITFQKVATVGGQQVLGTFTQTADKKDISVIIPAGARYVFTCVETKSATGKEEYYFGTASADLAANINQLSIKTGLLQEETEQVAKATSSFSLPITPKYQTYPGKFISPVGQIVDNDVFSISDPIEIPEGMTHLRFSDHAIQQYISTITFSKTSILSSADFISMYVHREDLDEVILQIPVDAKYIFISVQNNKVTGKEKYILQVNVLQVSAEVTQLKAIPAQIDALKDTIDTLTSTEVTTLLSYNGVLKNYYTTSVFSAWKVSNIKIKKKKVLEGITFRVKARETAITKVVCIFEHNGVTFSKNLDVSVPANTTKDIQFLFDDKVSLHVGDVVAVGYKCDTFCDMVGSTTLEKGLDTYYGINGNMNAGRWTLIDENYRDKEQPYFAVNVVTFAPGSDDDEDEDDEDDEDAVNKLKLPEQYELVVGDTFELFYKGIMDVINTEIYDFELTFASGANYGQAFKRKFVWHPEAKHVGEHVLNIDVRDNTGAIVAYGSTKLKVTNIPSSPSSNKVVLCVGDSLTQGGEWCAEFYRRLTASDGAPVGYALKNIQFIGERVKNNAHYVGTGGWTFDNYNTSKIDGKSYRIFGTFNKAVEDQHSVYRDTVGNTWKLETINTDSLELILVEGETYGLPSSGELTWVSGGTNRNAISYNSSELVAGNPFWDVNTSKVDFAKYATSKGVSSIDYCYVLLGWNSTYLKESAYKSQVRTFLDNLLAAFPKCKITLVGVQVPSRDGFGQNYGVAWKYYGKLQSVWNFDKWYAEIAKESTYATQVDSLSIAGQFDTEYNMQQTSVPVNIRSTITESRQSNGVHPAYGGYMQIADAVLRNFATKI